jgi:hypothetical protein
MHVATEDQYDENKAPPSLSDRGVARRRLIRAGAAGAGVLLSLDSRAALTSPVCASPSGSLSGGLNSHTGQDTCAGGFKPEYWSSKDVAWPPGLDRKTLAFTTVFDMKDKTCQMMPAPDNTSGPSSGTGSTGTTGSTGSTGSTGTTGTTGSTGGAGKMVPVPSYQCALLADVLSPQPYDADNLGMYMAATYLNICGGHVSFMDVTTLQGIWIEVSGKGYYEPVGGITWTREELKQYFKSTMNLV